MDDVITYYIDLHNHTDNNKKQESHPLGFSFSLQLSHLDFIDILIEKQKLIVQNRQITLPEAAGLVSLGAVGLWRGRWSNSVQSVLHGFVRSVLLAKNSNVLGVLQPFTQIIRNKIKMINSSELVLCAFVK